MRASESIWERPIQGQMVKRCLRRYQFDDVFAWPLFVDENDPIKGLRGKMPTSLKKPDLASDSRTISHSTHRLILFVLSVATIVATIGLWRSHRHRLENATLKELALSKLHDDAPRPLFDGTHPCIYAPVSGDRVTASIGRCAVAAIQQGALDQFEVDLRYGVFVMRQTDLQLQDVFDVPLTRTYNSDDWLSTQPVHAFGRNSNHPYDEAPLGARNPYTHMILALGDGDYLYFKRVSDGTGYSDAVYQHTETSTRFYKSVIYWNGDGWTLRLEDGSEVLFPESYAAKNLAQGAAKEIRDPQGNKLELKRDLQRNLKEILTPNGHWIKFTYDGQARIIRADDDRGNWARYVYDNHGMLTDAIHSSGASRHYEYRGVLMTAIKDEQGNTLLNNVYQNGLLIQQTYPNGDVYRFRYVLNSKRTYAIEAIVTLPDGDEREVETAGSVPEDLR